MSDPQPIPGRRQLPRAEPLQPDRPARGRQSDSPQVKSDETSAAESFERRKEQGEAALSNVRKGYGGPGK